MTTLAEARAGLPVARAGEPTEQELLDLKAQFGDVWEWSSSSVSSKVFFRAPSEPEWHRFYDLTEPRKTGGTVDVYTAERLLVESVVVWPDKDAFAGLLQRYPGIPDAMADQVALTAGRDRRASVKKV